MIFFSPPLLEDAQRDHRTCGIDDDYWSSVHRGHVPDGRVRMFRSIQIVFTVFAKQLINNPDDTLSQFSIGEDANPSGFAEKPICDDFWEAGCKWWQEET